MAQLAVYVPRGTAVYSSDGRWVGKVVSWHPGFVQFGRGGTSTDDTQEMQPVPPAVLELLDRLDLPFQLREQLAVSGFVKVGGRHREPARYFLPDQIAKVEPGRLTVNETVPA